MPPCASGRPENARKYHLEHTSAWPCPASARETYRVMLSRSQAYKSSSRRNHCRTPSWYACSSVAQHCTTYCRHCSRPATGNACNAPPPRVWPDICNNPRYLSTPHHPIKQERQRPFAPTHPGSETVEYRDLSILFMIAGDSITSSRLRRHAATPKRPCAEQVNVKRRSKYC